MGPMTRSSLFTFPALCLGSLLQARCGNTTSAPGMTTSISHDAGVSLHQLTYMYQPGVRIDDGGGSRWVQPPLQLSLSEVLRCPKKMTVEELATLETAHAQGCLTQMEFDAVPQVQVNESDRVDREVGRVLERHGRSPHLAVTLGLGALIVGVLLCLASSVRRSLKVKEAPRTLPQESIKNDPNPAYVIDRAEKQRKLEEYLDKWDKSAAIGDLMIQGDLLRNDIKKSSKSMPLDQVPEAYLRALDVVGDDFFEKKEDGALEKDKQVLAVRFWEDAFKMYEKAHEVCDWDARPFLRAGFIEIKCGKLDDAIVSFTNAIKLDPLLGEAYFGRGIALEKKSASSEEALENFTKAEKLSPGNMEYKVASRRVKDSILDVKSKENTPLMKELLDALKKSDVDEVFDSLRSCNDFLTNRLRSNFAKRKGDFSKEKEEDLKKSLHDFLAACRGHSQSPSETPLLAVGSRDIPEELPQLSILLDDGETRLLLYATSAGDELVWHMTLKPTGMTLVELENRWRALSRNM